MARKPTKPVEPEARTLTIVNPKGLHARAAAKLVKLAGEFESEITLERAGMTVSALSIMGLLLLAASKGTSVVVTATGADRIKALASLQGLIESGFGEI